MTNDRSDLNFVNILLKETQRFCLRHRLVESGALVIAAVSGGADSLALLDILWRWRQEGGGFTLAGAHYNHRLRPEADAEQALVEGVFQTYGIPYFVETGDVKGQAQAEHRSLHDMGREMRYTALLRRGMALFERLRLPQDTETAPRLVLATAHHRDDQVETVLLNLFQGAGLEGMAGIRPRLKWHCGVEGIIIRPLLSLRREDLERYCRIQGLNFASDRSNFDLSYPRNRIRHQLKPEIIRLFGEKAWDNLARIAEEMNEENNERSLELQTAYKDTLIQTLKKEVVLDYIRFSSYFNMMKYYILRRAVEQLTGKHPRLATRRLQSALDFLSEETPGVIELGGVVDITRKGGRLFLFLPLEPISAVKVSIPGETSLPPEWGSLSIRYIEPDTVIIPAPAGKLYADADALVGAELWLKPAQPGDRMVTLGMTGHQRVFQILSEHGIPEHRRHYPLLWLGDEIIAIAGLRIADRVKVTPATKRVCEIVFKSSSFCMNSKHMLR